jgi:hypothetical protein
MVFLWIGWVTVSSLATAAGTLVLSLATFAAVRSSNRSARVAEAALQEQRRPLLAPSRLEDPKQKIMFLEGIWVSAPGGRAALEIHEGAVYLAISLRNVGSGIAVCQGWAAKVGQGLTSILPAHTPLEDLRLQSRDLYVPAGDIGMWQGALRNPDDPVRAALVDAIEAGQPIEVEVLYSDQVGRQRTISRFRLVLAGDTWLASLNRHWYLDWDGPRPEDLTLAAAQVILRDQEAASQRREAAAGAETGAASDDADATEVAESARSDGPRPNPADQ